jgi:chaperonin cofactor prefoldin
MIELMCAVAVGLVFGYLLSKEKQPPAVDILTNQVELLEKEVAYYKDLCKWHTERNKHE